MKHARASIADNEEKWLGAGGPARLSRALLAWYDRHGRDLAWRRRDGVPPDPYRVWVSEIMLQQTTAATVTKRYSAFLARWPSVEALASASLDDVLTEWAGLGYYARARNLHRCACVVASDFKGNFPDSESELRALPGIGAYTAAAMSAIAFGRRAVVVDGNVERVLSRLAAVTDPMPGAKGRIRRIADLLTPHSRPGDYAQALMDLGATVCTPASPRCQQCPWRRYCRAYADGNMDTYPRRTSKPDRPKRFGVAFWITDRRGRVALRKRAPKGLLGGMMEVPGTPWRDRPWTVGEAWCAAPVNAKWELLDVGVSHVFSHFSLDLQIAVAKAVRDRIPEVIWVAADRLDEVPLPTLMRKVAKVAMSR